MRSRRPSRRAPGRGEFDSRDVWDCDDTLDAQPQPLGRTADKLLPDLRYLRRVQNLTDRRRIFEIMRAEAAEAYRAENGSVWLPRSAATTNS